MNFRFLSVLLIAFLVAGPALADKDKNCQVISEALDPTEAQGTNDFLNLTDGTFGAARTSDDEFTIPVDMKVSKLRVSTTTAPGSGDIWTITIMDDADDTTVTCTISGTATSCADMSHVWVAGAGTKLVTSISSAEGASDPTSTSEMLISFCLSEK